MRIAYNPMCMSLVSVCIYISNGGRTTETRRAGKGLLPLFILIITCPRYWPIELSRILYLYIIITKWGTNHRNKTRARGQTRGHPS